jgi:hypothetical protein
MFARDISMWYGNVGADECPRMHRLQSLIEGLRFAQDDVKEERRKKGEIAPVNGCRRAGRDVS